MKATLQSIKRSFIFRAPHALALTRQKKTAARAPRSLILFRAALPLALSNQMSAARLALVLKNISQCQLTYFSFGNFCATFILETVISIWAIRKSEIESIKIMSKCRKKLDNS